LQLAYTNQAILTWANCHGCALNTKYVRIVVPFDVNVAPIRAASAVAWVAVQSAQGGLVRNADAIVGPTLEMFLHEVGHAVFDYLSVPVLERECVDYFVTLGEAHLRGILRAYAHNYNDIRTHQSLDKDAPVSRPVQRIGIISLSSILRGLHHHYARVYVFGTHRPLRVTKLCACVRKQPKLKAGLCCPFRKSYPDVLVMQPSQDRNGYNGARSLDGSMKGRIFL
jgi:hypothetical protein